MERSDCLSWLVLSEMPNNAPEVSELVGFVAVMKLSDMNIWRFELEQMRYWLCIASERVNSQNI